MGNEQERSLRKKLDPDLSDGLEQENTERKERGRIRKGNPEDSKETWTPGGSSREATIKEKIPI